MKIAFYAPMKAPDHPNPSGDRQIGRLLIAALEGHGATVTLASRLRTWQKAPDDAAFNAIEVQATTEAAALIERWHSADRPDVWLTYHVYYKAHDPLGPRVAEALGLPYVIVEASHAARRQTGPWARGHAETLKALRRADAVVALHAVDEIGLSAVVPEHRLFRLHPFIDAEPFAASGHDRHGEPARLLAVGMMRHGDKAASYRQLADALSRLGDLAWCLTLVGDGEAADTLRPLFPADRTTFAGILDQAGVAAACRDADLYVWPAVNEAFGIALLEAQAAGLPVVAGRTGGVPDVIGDGETGLLVPPGDTAAFADAVRALISDPERRRAMGRAAAARVDSRHDMPAARRALGAILDAAIAHRRGALA